MLINHPEALKGWLIVVLEPLCDADSSALARYVLALLKKDKPEKELKRVMIEQLDVFLGEETRPFVERLLNAITTEEYLTIPVQILDKSDESVTNAAIEIDANVAKHQQESSNFAVKLDGPSTIPDLVQNIQIPQNAETKAKENQNIIKPSEATELTAQLVMKTDAYAASNALFSPGHVVRSASPPASVTNANKENQPREKRRRRASLPSRSRSRSRSRSNDRLYRRSRSRDRRASEREKNQRQFRNKSPPASDVRHPGTHERRRGGGGGGGDRRRTANSGMVDDRSPRATEGGRKTRANRSIDRSLSPTTDRNRNKTSPTVTSRSMRGSLDRDRHHHLHVPGEGEIRQRCRDFDEKGYCVRGETCPWDHGVNPVVFEDINNSALISISLREYNPDAPDLWTRSTAPGSMPAGATPGIAGNVGVGNAGINPFSGNARTNAVMMNAVGGPGFPPVGVDKATNGNNAHNADYVRSAASGAGFRAAAPMIPFPFNPVATPLQRELIPIPVVDANVGSGGDVGTVLQQGKRRFELEDSVAVADGPSKRKIPLNNRLGPRMTNNQNNCSLELRKVPRGLNSIAHLNNHFAKFGKIVNIQITYDGDPEAAIVTFSTHAEANVAYRSTEAVLNNRFIKVFWHSSQDLGISTSNIDTPSVSLTSGRKNSQYHLNNVPAVPTPTADSAKTTNYNATISQTTTADTTSNATAAAGAETTTTVSTAVAASHMIPSSLRLKNTASRAMSAGATSAIRKKQEEQAKAVVQLANRLLKRKQELLQSYMKQVKSALELLERIDQNDPLRPKMLETIKALQETIDKLRKEIAADQEQQMQSQMLNQQHALPPRKTKEQQKKELLDIELELFAQQQEGTDTSAIQKRLEELQRSLGIAPSSAGNAAVLHGLSASGRVPHFANNRGNNRMRPSFPEGSTRVDRRPKTIIVTGFSNDETDFVLGHFKHFGEITKHEVNNDIPQLTLSYATRVNAEQAVLRGKIFKDKRLQISWAAGVQSSTSTVAPIAMENKTSLSDIKTGTDTTANNFVATLDVTEKTVGEVEGAVIDTLPELKLEDEEEDDESEDRSWRR